MSVYFHNIRPLATTPMSTGPTHGTIHTRAPLSKVRHTAQVALPLEPCVSPFAITLPTAAQDNQPIEPPMKRTTYRCQASRLTYAPLFLFPRPVQLTGSLTPRIVPPDCLMASYTGIDECQNSRHSQRLTYPPEGSGVWPPSEKI